MLSPALIAIIASIALMPNIPYSPLHPVHANITGVATLAVSSVANPGDSLFVGNPGDTFTLQVLLDNAPALVGYDVSLIYNGHAIHASSVDFLMHTPFVGHSPLILHNNVSDASGVIRSTEVLQGGDSVDVTDFTTGPLPIFTVTFTVVARASSPLHIITDQECICQSLVVLDSGSVVDQPVITFDGMFFAEPNVQLSKWNATIANNQKTSILAHGDKSVTLISEVRLRSNETVAGYAFVVFDIIDPNGVDNPLLSNTVFILPGQQLQVTANFNFGTLTGVYTVFVTLWRGSDPNAMAPFETATGQHFQVKAK